MPDGRHRIAAGSVSAEILDAGAELCSFRVHDVEYLWQAGPVWPRHAPVLFPIVGRLTDDRLRHDGRVYRLTQHGFARDRRFTCVEHTATRCVMQLRDDAATRAMFPFGFMLQITYEVVDGALVMATWIANIGDTELPASFGAHPAFRWPLVSGTDRDRHEILFDTDEPAPIRRLTNGLIQPGTVPSPVRDRRLALSDALFARDALVFDAVRSHALRYCAPDGTCLHLQWDGFPQLGIWSRVGGDFVCLEPWHGFASPAGFDGPFIDKPGLMHIPAGGFRDLHIAMRISHAD